MCYEIFPINPLILGYVKPNSFLLFLIKSFQKYEIYKEQPGIIKLENEVTQ